MGDKGTLTSSFAWKLSERLLSQGIGLIIQIVIARMVKPEAIGEMTILLSIVNIFYVIAQSGFSSYIIQKKHLDNEVVSTIATFSIILASICVVICILIGDWLMRIIGYPELGTYLKIFGLVLFSHSINGICQGLLSREMQFKKMFFRTLIILPLSAAVCFSFIFFGFELEALIAYYIANPALTTVFMLVLLRGQKYKIRFKLYMNLLKEALPYSSRVLAQDIGNSICNLLRNSMIGGMYSATDLAYYDRSFTYTSYVEESITYTATSVLLPAMAKVQDEKERFNGYMVKATALYSIIVIPALFGFAAISPTLTETILGEKWLPCVPYICIFAVGFLHYPILTIHRPSFLACGRSDVTLKISLVQYTITLISVLITVQFSPIFVAVGTSFSLLMYIPMFVTATKKYMKIPVRQQLGPMIKYTILSTVMALAIYPMNDLRLHGILIMLIQICSGIVLYITMLIATRDKIFIESSREAIKLVKKVMRKR